MVEEGNQIASITVNKPITEFLTKMFCCPNSKRVFSPQNWHTYYKIVRQGNISIAKWGDSTLTVPAFHARYPDRTFDSVIVDGCQQNINLLVRIQTIRTKLKTIRQLTCVFWRTAAGSIATAGQKVWISKKFEKLNLKFILKSIEILTCKLHINSHNTVSED